MSKQAKHKIPPAQQTEAEYDHERQNFTHTHKK